MSREDIIAMLTAERDQLLHEARVVDETLALLAAKQPGDLEAAAPKVPFRHDAVHPYHIYRCDAAATSMAPLSMEDWSDVRALQPNQGALCDLESEYDSYRKENGADGNAVLTLTQFLPVWRKYRRGQMPQEWIVAALHEAELAAGLRHQATC